MRPRAERRRVVVSRLKFFTADFLFVVFW